MAISAVRRDRARRQELLDIKERIKANLPSLSQRQIRRHRIAYHEALILELEEDGYTESATFLKLLIDFQDRMRNEAGNESYVWFYPQLKLEREKLLIMYNGLRSAEHAMQSKNFKVEVEKILELGIYFSNLKLDWWWLAKQLLLQASECGQNYRDDGGRMESVCRFVLGRFYLNQLNEVDNAIEELKICREKSAGKTQWNARKELGIETLDNLFVESCILLYKALLILSKLCLDEDPARAGRICRIAQNRAKDAQTEKGISECLLQLGICELREGNATEALQKFNKVLTMSLAAQDPERICEARIQIALAHSRLGNSQESNDQLESLLNYAFDQELDYFYGQAHRFLGELYLNRGEPKLATPLLIKAVEIFMRIEDQENMEQVKNLAAISAGQEMLPRYVKLLLDCEHEDRQVKEQSLINLVKWKDSRRAFWSPSSQISLSAYCMGTVGEVFLEPSLPSVVDSNDMISSSTLLMINKFYNEFSSQLEYNEFMEQEEDDYHEEIFRRETYESENYSEALFFRRKDNIKESVAAESEESKSERIIGEIDFDEKSFDLKSNKTN